MLSVIVLEDFRAGPPLLPAAQASLPPSKPLRPHVNAPWGAGKVMGRAVLPGQNVCCGNRDGFRRWPRRAADSVQMSVGLDGPVDGALGVPLGGVGPLVVELFALAQAQLQLDPPVLEVEGQGNQGVALQFALLVQAANLALVGQEPPLPGGVGVEDVAVVVGGDVHPLDDQLAAVDVHPAVFQIDAAGPQAFHLGALQLDAGLQRFHHKVFVARFPVGGNGFGGRFFLSRHPARLLSF